MALPMRRRGSAEAEASPRLVNAALGVWLFISAFVWPNSGPQMTNTWVCGVLCVAFAITGMGVPRARYLNTALGVWLYVTAWALPTQHVATLWNNVLCAIAIFVLSLVSSDSTRLPAGLARLARST